MGNLLMFHLQSARPYNVYLSNQTTSKQPQNRGVGISQNYPHPLTYHPSITKPLIYANNAKKHKKTRTYWSTFNRESYDKSLDCPAVALKTFKKVNDTFTSSLFTAWLYQSHTYLLHFVFSVILHTFAIHTCVLS